MRIRAHSSLKAAFFTLAVSVPSVAIPQAASVEEKFDSENAILDTSILFSIGAQEASQSLRGSFGWPTFQEGLVEGVYFRFDPDGYARFSPVPRLDVDVFEVICRPRTYNCLARKGDLNIFLNARGQLQLKIEGIAEGDRFYLAEGVSEIELPESILQPLDNRFEALLLAGGELIVRRGGEEFERVSLVGFSASSTYLRWIAARQDYSILPRGWPVPNSRADTPGNVTQPTTWNSPMPKPQRIEGVDLSKETKTLSDFGEQQRNNQSAELAAVKSELTELRNLLAGDGGESPVAAMAQPPVAINTLQQPQLSAPLGVEGALIERVSRLEESLRELETVDNFDALTSSADVAGGIKIGLQTYVGQDEEVRNGDISQLRQFLLIKFGLSEVEVEKIVELATQQGTDQPFNLFDADASFPIDDNRLVVREEDIFRTQEVDQILADLEQQLSPSSELEIHKDAKNANEIEENYKVFELDEYLTLAAYFKFLNSP